MEVWLKWVQLSLLSAKVSVQELFTELTLLVNQNVCQHEPTLEKPGVFAFIVE